jgi:hypothetical protein
MDLAMIHGRHVRVLGENRYGHLPPYQSLIFTHSGAVPIMLARCKCGFLWQATGRLVCPKCLKDVNINTTKLTEELLNAVKRDYSRSVQAWRDNEDSEIFESFAMD